MSQMTLSIQLDDLSLGWVGVGGDGVERPTARTSGCKVVDLSSQNSLSHSLVLTDGTTLAKLSMISLKTRPLHASPPACVPFLLTTPFQPIAANDCRDHYLN